MKQTKPTHKKLPDWTLTDGAIVTHGGVKYTYESPTLGGYNTLKSRERYVLTGDVRLINDVMFYAWIVCKIGLFQKAYVTWREV